MIEQLNLQSAGVPADHTIQRDASGGANDGHISFGFDPATPVTTEPLPSGPSSISTNYSFDAAAGTGTATSVQQGGSFLTLHHPLQLSSDEGRGVELFDRLSAGPNRDRIADELLNHSHITGSLARDIRPLALAIAQRCITVTGGPTITATQDITSTPAFASTAPLAFFNSRNGITSFNQLYDDTRQRAWSLTRRKADIQKIALDRTADPYTAPLPPPDVDGLIQEFGASTSGISGGSGGTDTSNARLRQEVFRRPTTGFTPDSTVMGGIYVDRELQSNTDFLALYRYFLEPLGVSVDKWSMGVRGRSRTYTFADLFGGYNSTIATELKGSLGIDLSTSMADACDAMIPMVDSLFTTLPDSTRPGAVPKYTDIQRIFNKSCIECHGGLGYPPYHNYGTFLDLSEDEDPPTGDRRMTRSYDNAIAVTSPPSGTDVF
ncbi:MAG: hypothetical protein U9Q81_14675, partial [Pseudomonadota bacterium]|nr:hypothetical protein [Pseudomonadota bacterium]